MIKVLGQNVVAQEKWEEAEVNFRSAVLKFILQSKIQLYTTWSELGHTVCQTADIDRGNVHHSMEPDSFKGTKLKDLYDFVTSPISGA